MATLRHHVHRVKHHLKNTFIPHEGNRYRPHALHRHALGAYGLLALAVKIVVVVSVGLFAGLARQSDVTPETIVNLSNNARQTRNIPALKANTQLTKVSQAKLNNMFKEQYFAHTSPSNKSPWFWFKQVGYAYTYAGENLAIDFLQSEDIITAWLNSPTHRRNLLNPKFRDIGVSVGSGKMNGIVSLIVVQEFGTPVATLTSTPPVAVTPKPIPKPIVPLPTPKPIPKPAPTPKPVVLGEAVTVPVITSVPATATLATSFPTIVGLAGANIQVQLIVDGQGQTTATADSHGAFSLQPTNALSEGSHVIAVRSGSSTSTSVAITVDTTPPDIHAATSYALLSPSGINTYDLRIVAPEASTISAQYGSRQWLLTKHADAFIGRVQLAGLVSPAGVLAVTATDIAGNTTVATMAEPDLIGSDVVAPTNGTATTLLRLIFYSRQFFLIFLSFIAVMTMVNLLVHWERQHRPTVVGTLILLFLAGTFLII